MKTSILTLGMISAVLLVLVTSLCGCENCATINGQEVCGQCVGDDNQRKPCGAPCDLCSEDEDACLSHSAAICDGSGCTELNTTNDPAFDLEQAKSAYCAEQR